MEVQQTGDHNETPNLKRIKRHHAREYAQSSTAARALWQMEQDGVPAEHRPQPWQLKNFRPQRKKGYERKLSTDCLGSLRSFVESPPPTMKVDQSSMVLTETDVTVVFWCPSAEEQMAKLKLPGFLCDATFDTNDMSLALSAIGPVGLFVDGRKKPCMRFLPVYFLLSRTEDDGSHCVLFRQYVQTAIANGIELTDGYFDCFVMNSARSFFGGDDFQQPISLHRCLQHTKSNLRAEARKRDPASGVPRLRNSELCRFLWNLFIGL